MTALDDRSLGWLRYLHRKATTPDNWDRNGQPHPHWDATTGEPMTSWHRFDLIDSSYAVALMSDRTPAWREVYSRILDELVSRHTSWWSASDWMTQFGHDPQRTAYPDRYRPIIPPAHWGDYDVPGWTANGIEPYGVQPDPIAADGMLFFKGFFTLLMSLQNGVDNAEVLARHVPCRVVPTVVYVAVILIEVVPRSKLVVPVGCHSIKVQ